MEFHKLFEMDEADHPAAFYALPVEPDLNIWEIAQGTMDPPSPCTFQHNCGKRTFDVIGSGSASLLLLSSRAIAVLHGGDFTGWKSFPVEITGRLGKRITGYEGLVITGRSGPIDWSKGVYRRMPPRIASSNPYDAWIGMYFDPESWEGSDLFMPEGTTYPIVVERVKAAFERAEITNVQFKPLTEFERTWAV